MPKNFQKRNNVWSNKGRHSGGSYNEHDDRDRDNTSRPSDITIRKSKTNDNRRVSFKNANVGTSNASSIQLKLRKKYVVQGLRSQIEEDDERMVDFDPHKTSTFRRRNSPIPGSARNNKAKGLVENGTGWYQVTLPHGKNYGKDLILKSLLTAMSPEIFIPHYWTEPTDSKSVIFYVDDFKMAKILANLDRTIDMPNGFKLMLKVRSGSPPFKLDEKVHERMKLAMHKRYNLSARALDLTQFHLDADLRDIYCGLSRAPIFTAAADIIVENIAELEALNLDGNKIYTLDPLKHFLKKLPNLKILYLSNNKIGSANTLETLRTSNIVDLVLKGNPICERLRGDAYVREIRKRVPKLQKLDGIELPPQIGFDVDNEEETKLPTPKGLYLVDQAGSDIVRQFLQQYFMVFDSDNRQPLLDAYHENAMFSLTCTYHPNPDIRLVKFLPHSRNLMRVRDDRRMTLLKCGRLPVVSFLSELPKSEHDPQSFAVDLTLFTPSMMMLSVTGIFREKQTGTPISAARNDLRSFHRSLVIVPVGSGFCIKNDILHVTQLTIAQVKTAFKPIAPVPVTTGPVQPPVVPTPTSALNTSLQPDDATKLQMIEAMAQHSKMNLEWSRKCLEETNWDFNRAGYVFTELNNQGKIPPEAFIK